MKKSKESEHTDCRFSMLRLLFIMKLCFIIAVINVSTISANSPAQGSQQQKRITGTITDSSTGETLPGVNIAMKGTSVGTISDADGKYDLTIPDPNGTLVFTFIGYKTQEVTAAGRQVVDVALVLEELALEEVVVVGYGTKTKSTVTGSISTVSSARS